MNPKILFEDDELLVIDKPFGVTVNRSDTTKEEETVQDWSQAYLKLTEPTDKTKLMDATGMYRNAFWDRGGIVHRLDKETSGILLLAKSPESFLELQRQFRERIVKKTYIALVHGKPITIEGEITVPIGRLPWNRKRFGVMPAGREARTEYKLLQTYHLREKKKEIVSLLELYPLTGRTHQIRVHLKYLNLPIFSDFLYAGRKTSLKDRKVLSRVFLHAAKISFLHPRTGEALQFESPLPDELTSFMQNHLEKTL